MPNTFNAEISHIPARSRRNKNQLTAYAAAASVTANALTSPTGTDALHVHPNLADLNRIATDAKQYLYLSVPTTDSSGNLTKLEKAKVGYADQAESAQRADEADTADFAIRAERANEAEHAINADSALMADMAKELTPDSPTRNDFLSSIKADRAEGEITFAKDTFFGDYVGGLAGNGGKIDEQANAELQSMALRSWLSVPQINFNRVMGIAGTQWRSVGGGRIDEVTIKSSSQLKEIAAELNFNATEYENGRPVKIRIFRPAQATKIGGNITLMCSFTPGETNVGSFLGLKAIKILAKNGQYLTIDWARRTTNAADVQVYTHGINGVGAQLLPTNYELMPTRYNLTEGIICYNVNATESPILDFAFRLTNLPIIDIDQFEIEIHCFTRTGAFCENDGKLRQYNLRILAPTLNDNQGKATLKLEEGELPTIQTGDLCIGIFHNLACDNATETADDGHGNFTFSGFATAYFRIDSVSASEFAYTLRPGTTTHPCKHMEFIVLCNPEDTNRQSCRYSTPRYERYIENLTSWEIMPQNVAAQFGDLSNLGQDMTGYSAYLNNLYISGRMHRASILPKMQIQTIGGNVLTTDTYITLKAVVTLDEEEITEQVTNWAIERKSADGTDADKAWANEANKRIQNGTIRIYFNDLGQNSPTAGAEYTIHAYVNNTRIASSTV